MIALEGIIGDLLHAEAHLEQARDTLKRATNTLGALMREADKTNVWDTEPNTPEREAAVDAYLSRRRAEHPDRW